jgi:serine/threonine-protein kinase
MDMAPTELLAPGSVFAERFRVVELLGEGEMGATYAVDPLAGGARCALKVMVIALAKGDAWRARFATEAKGTAGVASASLLQTLDAGIDSVSGRPWFTTELLRGEDLSTRVARDGARPLPEVRALVDALGDALGKAHAKGLVHYDLTPENVHLGPGAPFKARLRELTISRLVAEACAAEGDLIGTALWMSPEQFDLGRALTPASNIWSLGLLAFYAATGHAYWTTASNDPAPSKELLRQILGDPLAPASDRARELGGGGGLPPRFDSWFARCVARDPRGRFADAHAARAAFAALLEGRGADAEDERPTLPLPERRAPPRRRRSVSHADIAEIMSQALPAPDLTPPVSSTPPPASTAARPPTAPQGRARRGGRAVRYLVLASMLAAVAFWLRAERHLESGAGEPRPPLASAASATASASAATAAGAAAAPADATPTAAPSAGAPIASATVAPSAARGVVLFADAADAAQPSASGGAGEEILDYDLATALKALNRVYYGDCHVPSTGQIAVTFATSGRVKKVTVVQGDYDERTVGCIAARFGAARMSPFRGGPQTVTASLVSTP